MTRTLRVFSISSVNLTSRNTTILVQEFRKGHCYKHAKIVTRFQYARKSEAEKLRIRTPGWLSPVHVGNNIKF